MHMYTKTLRKTSFAIMFTRINGWPKAAKNHNTKYSRVLGMSKIDLTPAEITVTGVFPSSVKSEEMSISENEKKKNERFL